MQYTKPTKYEGVFSYAATRDGANILVNYSSVVTNISSIVISGGTTPHVTKGELLD